jgi:hypothetical protein
LLFAYANPVASKATIKNFMSYSFNPLSFLSP